MSTQTFFNRLSRGQSVDFLGASANAYEGISVVNRFGQNDDIATLYETVWDVGGIYTYISSATILEISSDLAGDSATGSGASVIRIEGLDGSHTEVSELVELDGQSAVDTVNSYLRVHQMEVMSAGAFGGQLGLCFAGTGSLTNGVPATIYAQMSSEHNQTEMALYTIPVGKTGFVVRKFGSTNKDKETDFHFSVRPFNEVFKVKEHDSMYQASFDVSFPLPFKYTEKTDIEVRAKVRTSTALVAGGFDLILFDNSLLV